MVRPPFKSEIRRKKAPSGSAPRPPEEDGPKCPPATDLKRQKMYVDLYIEIVDR